MTKAELIERIARSRELPPDVTKKVIAKILDLTFAELAAYFVRSRLTRSSTPRFSYPKFGTFIKKKRSGRRGVNPRTLEPMDIEACETVDFKPSTELKRLLNESTPAKSGTKTTAGRKKKAARSSGKTKSRSKKTRSKSGAKSPGKTAKSPGKTLTKAQAQVAGPGGRKLVTRDEAELELPSAPLQKVQEKVQASSPAKKRQRKLDPTAS